VKAIRYLNAAWVYYQYSRVLPKVSSHPNCLFTIAYEDLVNHPQLFSHRFEETTGIVLAALDPGAPASSVNVVRRDAFMKESLDAWKSQMPRWAQRMAEDVFFPQRGLRVLCKAWWLLAVIWPVHFLKKIVNNIRGQRT
jgi:hypothetical protein